MNDSLKQTSIHKTTWLVPFVCMLAGGALTGISTNVAKYAIDVLMLLLMFGPVVALLLWWGVACFKRRSRLSRFTRATARSTAQQRANAASIELDTESNNAASTGLATTPPAWGEQNRVQSRKAVMS